MDDLDAILADLQVSTSTPPPKPTPVYASPFRPAAGQAQAPLGEASLVDSIRTAPDPVELRPSLDVDSDTNVGAADDVSDDYVQELQRLQEPSRSSNIDDLDNLLDDLNFVQNNFNIDNVTPRDEIQSSYEEFPEIARSSATKDLDSLMESLQGFNNPPAPAERHSFQPPPISGSDTLDGMMASLDTDLAKKGVQVSKRGMCAACEKMIVGKMVTALGKTWHPEHFLCVRCKVELGSGNFFESNDQPYCEEDYHAEFSPRCAMCNQPIIDRCITALQKTWHPDCFVCVHCKESFIKSGTEYHVFEGKPYCKRDYYEMFAPKCGGCAKAIVNNVITALKKQWHVECFVCFECKNRFGAGTYFEHEGKPYCELHYHQHRGSLCAACNKPISGRVITAMRNKFHPEHFVCAFCITPLSKGTFKMRQKINETKTDKYRQKRQTNQDKNHYLDECKSYNIDGFMDADPRDPQEHESKPYCHTCYQKLFGMNNRG